MALNNHSRIRTAEKNGSANKEKELEHEFAFENVVQETCSSEQMFKKYIRDTFVECFQGARNVSIMAYGQTCSGKTHTILGVK